MPRATSPNPKTDVRRSLIKNLPAALRLPTRPVYSARSRVEYRNNLRKQKMWRLPYQRPCPGVKKATARRPGQSRPLSRHFATDPALFRLTTGRPSSNWRQLSARQCSLGRYVFARMRSRSVVGFRLKGGSGEQGFFSATKGDG